jgi:GNAT superfamily N-acetyltransferase
VDGVHLQQWDEPRVRARLDDIISVYKAAFLDVHEPDPVRAAAERKAYVRSHLSRHGLRVVVALDPRDDRVVGIAYGLPGRAGQWWHDVVWQALPPPAARDWLGDCFEVVELHVLPDFQGYGIGRRLLHRLLAGLPQRTAALSALEPTGSRARNLYSSEQFVPLLSEFCFPGSDTPYAVLAKRLPADGPGASDGRVSAGQRHGG